MKTTLVTGANGAIGKAICRQLARAGHSIIMVCRDPEKAEKACSEVKSESGNPNILYEIADLSREVEIEKLADRIKSPINNLINNAALTPKERKETPEGIEMQFASNVLNYFWMSLAFLPHLKNASPSRIINVASHWAGDLDLSDLEFKKRKYSNGTAYRQSKQANRMLTVALSEKFSASGISVNACHPGVVSSGLSNSMGFGGSDSPDQGAKTPVWLATSEEGGIKNGKWFSSCREENCQFAQDKKSILRLYEICLGLTHKISRNL